MPIDKKAVRWDESPDPAAVQWDEPDAPMEAGPSAVDGMSRMGRLRAGLGQSMVQSYQGVKGALADQMLRGAEVGESFASRINPVAAKQAGDIFRDARQGMYADDAERSRIEAPLMSDGWGMAGSIAGQTAQIMAPVGGAATALGRAAPYAAAAGRAGAFSALQPMQEGQSRLVEGGKGATLGLAGQGIASGVGALAQGGRRALEPGIAGLINKAEDFGIKLGAGQVSQNPLIRTMVSQMERLPFSGAGTRARANQETFNRGVGGEFGAEGSRITPEVFGAAK